MGTRPLGYVADSPPQTASPGSQWGKRSSGKVNASGSGATAPESPPIADSKSQENMPELKP